MNWSELRTVVLRTILKDPNASIFSHVSLLDAVAWALDSFAAHTAVVSSMVITADSTTTQFSLPGNLFVPLDIAGSVYTLESDNARTYYAPLVYTDETQIPADRQYDIIGNNILFQTAPTDNVTLRYFAAYPIPTSDTSEITVPRWGRMPVAYLTAAHALLNRMTENAEQRALPERAADMGGPEDSAYRAQYTFLLRQTELYLAKFPMQIRLLYTGDV